MPRETKQSDKNKAWNKREKLSKIPLFSREIRKKYLIICEGQTEELYFRSFPVATAEVISVGTGMTQYTLVQEARRRMKGDNYDEVWCVFDMDFNAERNGQLEDFNNAVFADNGKNFRCAYSNDAFELWFYLHYQGIEHNPLRTFYYEQLGILWEMNYVKEGKKQAFSKNIYAKLEQDARANQEEAIKRAKNLYQKHQETTNPHERNPITTVFELVEKLNAHIKLCH
jgi:RloB-like protein